MTREEYVNEVLSLVKSKYAKLEIEQELNAHIDDRIEYYTDAGYDYNYALYKAMEYMGEPEQVGARMNNIHNETPLLIVSIVLQVLFVFSMLVYTITLRYENFVIGFGMNNYIVEEIELFIIALLFAVNYYICSRHCFYKSTFALAIETVMFNPLGTIKYAFIILFGDGKLEYEGLDYLGKVGQTIFECFVVYMLIASLITFCYASYQKAKLRQKVHSTIGLRYDACNKLFAFVTIIMLGLTIFVCFSA